MNFNMPTADRRATKPKPVYDKVWYCGHCGFGLMNYEREPSCHNCHLVRDSSAFVEETRARVTTPIATQGPFQPPRGSARQPNRPQDKAEAFTSHTESPPRPSTPDSSRGSAEELQDEQYLFGQALLCCNCGDILNLLFECDNCEHGHCIDCSVFQNDSSQDDNDHNIAIWKDWSQSIPLPDHVPSKAHYLRNPRSYVSVLGRIKQTVYEMSPIVEESKDVSSQGPNREDLCEPKASLQLESLKSMHAPDMKLTQLVKSIRWTSGLPKLFEELLRARNRMVRVCQMVLYMKAAGLVQDRVSIIVRNPADGSIACLIPIMIEQIFALARCLNECMLECVRGTSTVVVSKRTIATATEACEKVLRQLHCLPTGSPETLWKVFSERTEESASGRSQKDEVVLGNIRSRFKEQGIQISRLSDSWALTAKCLDLATVLCCGGHTFSVSQSRLPNYGSSFFSGDIHFAPRYSCSPERLKGCMKDFWNGNDIWILTLNPSALETAPVVRSAHSLRQPATLLQADIATLSDIWGPAQPVFLESGIRSQVVRYNVGNGHMFPWDEEIVDNVRREGMRLCHWLPRDLSRADAFVDPTSESTDTYYQDGIVRAGESLVDDSNFKAQWLIFAQNNPLKESDVLLIGADTALRQENCNCLTWLSRGHFCSSEAIHPLKTRAFSPTTDYGASTATNFSPGRPYGLDVPVAEHRYFKDVLIETWESDPDNCHPGDLDVLGGILVSRCTQNAMRCSLASLIWNPGMKRWLQRFRNSPRGQSIPFWDVFWEGGPSKVEQLWNSHEEWQSDMRYIITMCLRYLIYTGYDPITDKYNVLLVQDRKKLGWLRLERLVLKSSTHSWIRLLADSVDACAMAMIEESCLSIKTEAQQQFCRSDGNNSARTNFRPRLETRLAVNMDESPFRELHLATRRGLRMSNDNAQDHEEHQDLDLSTLKSGVQIYLESPSCYLRVVRPLSADHLLLEEDTRVRTRAQANSLQGHREYFDELGVDAIPKILIHIQSLDLSMYKRPQYLVQIGLQRNRFGSFMETMQAPMGRRI